MALPSFLADFLQALAAGVIVGGAYALMCIGLGIIFGSMRVINFAQGDFLMLGMYAAFYLTTGYGILAFLGPYAGPIVAATDYIRAFPDQIRPYVGERAFTSLGTDGFGRSDTRATLRSFFEVDRHHVVLAALHALGDEKAAKQAIKRYELDTEGEAPWLR